MIDYFIGKWIMDSNKNEYDTQKPPKSGSYTISLIEGKKLLFSMEWIDFIGKELEAFYTTYVDGKKHAYENSDVADFIETKMLSPNIMETITYKNEKINSKGTRELINENKTMLVTQTIFLPGEKEIVNKSVYNKQV